jgi:hypothetical protein
MNRIAIDITTVITTPSLFGIDHKVAYVNRKYHSGWIWTCVTSGFAGVKLSGLLGYKVPLVTVLIVLQIGLQIL